MQHDRRALERDVPRARAPTVVNYAFRVKIGRRTLWYGDDNSASDTTKGGTGRMTSSRGDNFHLTVYAGWFTTPAWLQGAVVYSIFPDRFRNGDPSNDYCRAGSTTGCPTFYGNVPALLHPTWNEPLEDSRATGVFNRDFFGGDLQGVTEKLDYLKALGVDAIWLTPIFKARSNHRYDTDDYLQVDPALGGDAAFAALSAAAKARGIRLILDGVFNHASSDSRYFDKYHRYPEVGACESPSSPFRSWFEITGNDVPCTQYSGFANLDSLPTLNDANAGVRDFVFRGSDSVVRHWVNRGADGWRLDVAHELSHDWWRDFRTTVKGYAPEAPLIGEITAGPVDATEYLFGNELDGVMNYRFRQIANGFARVTNWSDSSGTIPALRGTQAAHALEAILADYPKQAAAVSFNLVDSHDTNRALFVLTSRRHVPGRDGAAAARGAAAVHGVRRADDLLRRRGRDRRAGTVRLRRSVQPRAVSVDGRERQRRHVRAAGRLHAVLVHAARRAAASTCRRCGAGASSRCSRTTTCSRSRASAPPNRPVIVALNKGAQAATVAIPLRGLYPNGTELEDALGGAHVTTGQGRVNVSVPPRSGVVLFAR